MRLSQASVVFLLDWAVNFSCTVEWSYQASSNDFSIMLDELDYQGAALS